MGRGMGRIRTVGALAVVVFVVVFMGGFSPAGADAATATLTKVLKLNQQYDEEGASAQGPFTLTVYLTPVANGSTNYVVTGKVAGVTDGVPYIGGTGLVVGTNLILNLTLTQNNTTEKKRTGAVLQVTVNKTTYKGTYWWVGTRFNQSSLEFKDKYSYGTVAP